ncbi:PREDICTED: CASP-like protein 4D1 [Ipomoea nil]|uniref:CASP-like protein 4D1 n=1 Tax=Ipomoea nil TaxID=35883 RepID=UPI000901A345|nr:PREDICTED: CASP-like protein 4D1 [Ipomoea nil]
MSEFDRYIWDEEQKQQQPRKKSKLALVLLVSRVTTLVSLAISIVILKNSGKTYTGTVTYDGNTYENGYRITYSNYTSYEYMMFIMVVGCVYNLLQIPLAIYYFLRDKHLINNRRFVLFQFFADQVIMALLATALGAAFGATVDLDKGVRNKEKVEKNLHRYWRFMYLPAIFFLIGFITSIISSITTSITTLVSTEM